MPWGKSRRSSPRYSGEPREWSERLLAYSPTRLALHGQSQEVKLLLKSCKRCRNEEQALNPKLAARSVIPLGKSMCAAAFSATAQRDSRNLHGKRQICVGGTALDARRILQKTVHVTDCLQKRRIVRQFASGPGAERLDLHLQRASSRTTRRNLRCEPRLHGVAQRGFQTAKFGFILRTQIDLHGSIAGN